MSNEIYYDFLLEEEISNVVAIKLYGLSNVEELDTKTKEALKEFNNEFNEKHLLNVLNYFEKSDLTEVQNKSAFLLGIIKAYRAKVKRKEGSALTNAQSISKDKTSGEESSPGPSNETKGNELPDRTGYSLDDIKAGQGKHEGPQARLPRTTEKVRLEEIPFYHRHW